MPNITVRFYTILKEKLGTGSIELSCSNVGDCIRKLSEKFGEKFTQTVLDSKGKVKGYFILLLNGYVVDRKNLRKQKLKNGDVLHIFPPIAGG